MKNRTFVCNLLKKIQYICTVNTSDKTPMLLEMLSEMRRHLSADDIRAGLPESKDQAADISPLYGEWSALRHVERRQLERISELDSDIQKMEPWGDFPMANVDQLAQQGQRLAFWSCTRTVFDAHRREWSDAYQADLISERNGVCYFVTVTPQGADFVLTDAKSVQVAPSPVSTLLTLQTKAKDSLRQTRVRMGDFSMQHYREVEAALHLSDTLRLPEDRLLIVRYLRVFVRKIKQIFISNGNKQQKTERQ